MCHTVSSFEGSVTHFHTGTVVAELNIQQISEGTIKFLTYSNLFSVNYFTGINYGYSIKVLTGDVNCRAPGVRS